MNITDDVTATPPSDRLDLPRLAVHDYRLYPVVNQIADEVFRCSLTTIRASTLNETICAELSLPEARP